MTMTMKNDQKVPLGTNTNTFSNRNTDSCPPCSFFKSHEARLSLSNEYTS